MPRQWQGQETVLLKRESRATVEVAALGLATTAVDTAIGRLSRAVNYLLAALFAGDVTAVVASEDGRLRDFPPSLWIRPGIRASLRSGELPVEFRVAIEGHKAETGSTTAASQARHNPRPAGCRIATPRLAGKKDR